MSIIKNKRARTSRIMILVILIASAYGGYLLMYKSALEKELAFYAEYIENNEASGNHGIWTFEESNWTHTKTLKRVPPPTLRFQRVPFRELRKVIDLWKAPIIRYDENEGVIWTFVIYPEAEWVCYYWKE